VTERTKSGGWGLPILQGVLPIKGSRIPAELVAGLTLAALAIPEVMGYTKISGTPVITGLYTMLIPMALFTDAANADLSVLGRGRRIPERLLGMGLPASSSWPPYRRPSPLVEPFPVQRAHLTCCGLKNARSRSAR